MTTLMLVLVSVPSVAALIFWLSNKRLKGIINEHDKELNALRSSVKVEKFKGASVETRLKINEAIGGLDCGSTRARLSDAGDFID